MRIILIALLLSGCAAFDTPRIDVPFVVLEINDDINQFASFPDDMIWGKEDYWATPKEFYAKSGGDCEDYAIAKYFSLRHAGIPARSLKLANILLDDGETNHMILIYKEKFVLDNIVSRVTPINEYLDFKMMYKFNETGVYFNGLSGKVSAGHIPKWQNVLNKMKYAKGRD